MQTGNVQVLQLEFDIARREISQAQKTLNRLIRDVGASERTFRNQARAGDESAQAIDRIGDVSKSSAKSVGRLTDEQERAIRAANQATKAYDRQEARLRQLRSQQEQFNTTSRDVALAGDVQSNLGAIGGLAGAAGAESVAGGVAVAGEFSALVEELPRLKEAASGLPGTISSAVGALGVGGVAAGAGLIAALGLFAIEARRTAKVTEEAAKAQELIRSEYERTNELLGNTSDVISEAVQQDAATIETAQRNLESATEERERLEAQLQEEFGVDAAELSDFGLRRRGDVSPNAEFDSLIKSTIDAREDEQDALDSYLESSSQFEGSIGALTDEETQLADERARAAAQADAQSNQIAQAYQSEAQARQFAQNASSEQLNAELERIEVQRASTEEQLNEQLALSDESEAAQAQVASLRGELERLTMREEDLEQVARPLIQRREEETAAAERQEEAMERAKEKAEEFAKTVRERFDELVQKQVNTIRQRTQDAVRFAELEREASVDTATSNLQRLRDREAALQSELQSLEALAASGADVSDEIQKTQTNLSNARNDIERTFSDVLPAAIKRARDEIEGDLQADLRDLESERTEAIADANQKIAELEKERQVEQQEIEEDRREAINEFRQDEVQREREYARTLRDIREQGRRDVLKAAGALDSVALEEAIFNEEQKIEAEQERFAEETKQREQERKEIERRFQERQRDRRREFQSQRQAAQQELQQTRAKFNRQEAELRANAQKELNIIEQRFQREQQLYQQANNAILKGVQSLVERARNTFDFRGGGSSTTGGGAIEDIVATGKQRILEALGGGGGTTGSGGLNAGGGGTIRSQTTIQRFAGGGVFQGATPGYAVLEPGERVLSQRQTATFDRMVGALERIASQPSGGAMVNVNSGGTQTSMDEIRRMTRNELLMLLQARGS